MSTRIPQSVEKIVLYGVGLINGSLGLALRGRGFEGTIIGVGRREESLERAAERSAVDSWTLDERHAVHDADLVVVGTPVCVVAEVVGRLASQSPPGTVYTDVGSVKETIVRRCHELARASRFVGAHPIAGSERSGVDASDAELFVGATCVLTPTLSSDEEATTLVECVWEAVGARTVRLASDVHDLLLAASSHLPHVVACASVQVVGSSRNDGLSALDFAGTGFRDTTRIGAASPELWEAILHENARPVSALLRRLADELKNVADAMEACGRARVLEWLEDARDIRMNWRPPNGK